LKLKEVPKHLVIGGGVIGIELGQVYLRLGAVVEYLDRIIPGMDASLSKELTKVLKQGMKFYVSHKVKSVERNGEGVVVQAENAKEKLLRWKEIIH
jgi:dihydrolipoamide dehydrogenase